jgi:trans-aconitate methyltransferase
MTEWNASEYDRLSALQATLAEEVLSRLKLKGTEHILDIGCGDGATTAEIAARVPNGSVTGIDASAEMIAFAKAHWTSEHPNLQFQMADARHLPFEHEFDLIVSLNTLHWISDQASVLRSIRAAIRPDGRAQLRFVSKGPRKCVQDLVEETRRSSRWADNFPGFSDPFLHVTPEQYAALAEQQGFRVLSMRTSDKVWDFGCRDAFLARMQVTLIEWTQHVPERDRIAFITDALDRYQNVAVTAPGEENYFRFYQLDIELAPN